MGGQQHRRDPARPDRRRFLAGAGALTASAATAGSLAGIVRAAPAGALPNPVVAENELPGSTGWYKVFTNQSQHGEIEGHASSPTVAPGQLLTFHVSTDPAAPYRIEIYRIGHYAGAGARLVATLPDDDASYAGVPRTIPAPHAATGLVRLNWPLSASLVVPHDWVSGYHLAVFVITEGPHAGANSVYPFVVTAPASRPKVGLVHCSVTTWQAYNNWPGTERGGRSLYEYNSAGELRANRVSFRRPYNVVGNQNVFEWEVPLAQWLEAEGYDVAYTTDVDTHRAPDVLDQYRTVLIAGHDEYWSREIRHAFDHARDAGVSLGFLGANIGHWQIRFEDHESTIVCYKEADDDPVTDPSRTTVRFRDLEPPRPEAALIGTQFEWGLPVGYRTFTVRSETLDDPWFDGTGFRPGSTVTDVVGYEYDSLVAASPAGATVFFDYPGSPAEVLPPGHCTRYVHTSGAIVFSAGTMEWPARIRTDGRLEAFTRNAVDSLFAGALDPAGSPPSTPLTSRLVTVAPHRLFDTRTDGLGVGGVPGPIAADDTVDVVVAGVHGVPPDATAVVLNLTALQAAAPGFVTAFPTGDPQPLVSSVNTSPGDVVPNLVTVPVGAGGSISLYANVEVHVVGDLAGYHLPASSARAGRYVPLAPDRLLDTRADSSLEAGESRRIDVAGHPAVPGTGVDAAVVTLTAVRSLDPGFLTAHPSGGSRPLAAHLIARPGQTRTNLAVVPLGADGAIEVFSLGRTHLVVDLLGVVTGEEAEDSTSGLYVAVAPTRLFDTRQAPEPDGLVAPEHSMHVVLADGGLVPHDALATVQNVTTTGALASGYVTIHPAGTPRPLTAAVFVTDPSLSRGTTTFASHGAGGAVTYYSHAGCHLVSDVMGYFTP